ncbi:hemolysin family protein [Gordonia sp. NPDC003425]
MSNPWVVLAATIVLIAASAFFVSVEFSLIAARRHRLEDAAAHSRAARAAVRSAGELSVLLAGSQLGITVCTLALGAVTKPAVHHWLTPAVESLGAPLWLADIAGFVLALIIVTFLHLVVGEMAPKSWAITHPEKSAVLLAVPMRAFMWVTRPLIMQLNAMANWCLRRVGVQPVDQLSEGQDPDTLRELVDHSAQTGTLDAEYHARLSSALALESLTAGDVVTDSPLAVIDSGAGPGEIRAVSRDSGHSRLVVRSGGSGRDADALTGVVHVRDSLAAPSGTTAADFARPLARVAADLPVHEVLRRMRETRGHLALVTDGDRVRGVLSLDDVLTPLVASAG